jgi:hypothetical protein
MLARQSRPDTSLCMANCFCATFNKVLLQYSALVSASISMACFETVPRGEANRSAMSGLEVKRRASPTVRVVRERNIRRAVIFLQMLVLCSWRAGVSVEREGSWFSVCPTVRRRRDLGVVLRRAVWQGSMGAMQEHALARLNSCYDISLLDCQYCRDPASSLCNAVICRYLHYRSLGSPEC